MLKHIRKSVKKYFKTHSHGHNKKSYDQHKLPIIESSSILIEDITKELNKILSGERFIVQKENLVYITGHGAINLNRYFLKKGKKNIKKSSSSESKKKSKANESEASSDSSSESESDSNASSYDSKESSKEVGYAAKSNSTKTPQQPSSLDRIKATKEMVSIDLTSEKIDKVKKIIKKGVDNFFIDGKRKISTSSRQYKSFVMPLEGEELTAQEIAAGVYQLYHLALSNIELNVETKKVYILGSGVNTLGTKYLPQVKEHKNPPEPSTPIPMEIEKENKHTDELSISTSQKPVEIASSEVASLPVQSLVQNQGVVPISTNLLEIAAPFMTSSPQQTLAVESTKNYQPGFFKEVVDPTVSLAKDQKKEESLKRETPPDFAAASPAKKQKSEEIDEELIAKYARQQKYKEEIIKHIKLKINKITKNCNKLERHSMGVLKDYGISQNWSALIEKSKSKLSSLDLEQSPIKELKLINKQLSGMLEELHSANSKANEFLKSATTNQDAEEDFLPLSSDSEDEDKNKMEHSSPMFK